MTTTPTEIAIQSVIELLSTDGFIIDRDAPLSISVETEAELLSDNLSAAGWQGAFIVSCAEHGGQWPYWAYDANELTPDEAKIRAIAKWESA